MAPFYANEFGQCSEGHQKRSEVIGGGRKWSEVGSHRRWSEVVGSKKEGHMSNYYIVVKSEFICVIGSVKLDMWERKSVPYAGRMCKPERMRSRK